MAFFFFSGSDPNIVLELMEKVAMENKDTLKEPPPRALFEDFDIGTKSDVSIGIFNKFEENNIEIPFPQVDLHVKEQIGKIAEKNSDKK